MLRDGLMGMLEGDLGVVLEGCPDAMRRRSLADMRLVNCRTGESQLIKKAIN